MTTMRELQRMADTIDQRIRQLATEGVTGRALINRMVGHLPDLQRIWSDATDWQLRELCQHCPSFYEYASLMEEAAEAERNTPSLAYQDLPELPDDLKRMLSALLVNAATLEQGFQTLLDASKVRGMSRHMDTLRQLHRTWLGDRAHFAVVMKGAGVPLNSIKIVTLALGQMAERIAEIEKRACDEALK
jgi:hypothetical protein